MDGGILNSERGLVERILSGAAYHLHRLHRRMISAALDAGILLQSAGYVREMRIWVALSGESAICKTRDFGRKSDQIRDFRMFRVAKREKNSRRCLEFARFFRGTIFALPSVALTISSPETNSACPQAKAGLLEP